MFLVKKFTSFKVTTKHKYSLTPFSKPICYPAILFTFAEKTKNMRNTLVYIILVLLIVVACNRTSKEVTQTNEKTPEKTITTAPKKVEKTMVNEDFDGFYVKFHSDSTFQLKRIKFPLDGYSIDTSEASTSWAKNNWVMHKNTIQSIDTSMFKTEINKSNNSYSEKIYIDGGGFASERDFKRINGKWYLVKFIDEDL